MKDPITITNILTTNCTVVDAAADLRLIREVFSHFPNQFLPVMEGTRLVGVIFREEFFRNFLFSEEDSLLASDLVSKEMVVLHPRNSLSDAKALFDSCALDMVPVTDERGKLRGILFREDVEAVINVERRPPESCVFERKKFEKILGLC